MSKSIKFTVELFPSGQSEFSVLNTDYPEASPRQVSAFMLGLSDMLGRMKSWDDLGAKEYRIVKPDAQG